MAKGKPVPRRFLEVATGFVLVQVDTRNGQAPETKRLHVGRNDAYFLFLDSNGREFHRMIDPGNLALTRSIRWDAAIELMEKSLRKPPAGKEGFALLRSLLSDEVAYVRKSTAYRLSAMGASAAPLVPELLKLIDDKLAGRAAIRALGAIGPKANAAIPLLAKRLEAGAGYDMAFALAKIDRSGRTAVPVLMKCLDPKNPSLAIGALRGLGHLGAKSAPAVAELIGLLSTKANSVRCHAIEALGRIGPAAAGAIVNLEAILDGPKPKSKYWNVWTAAETALKRIRK